MTQTVLITGQNGYLGACLMHLLAQGPFRVVTLPGRLEQIEPGSLQADVVVHIASCLMSARAAEEVYQRVNVEGTERLLAGLRSPAPLIYLSSRQVYGPARSAFCSENDNPAPVSAYGRSKLLAERLIAQSGHPHCILRTTALFGAGVGHCGRTFVDSLPQTLRARQPVTLYTPDTPRDYLYVWDLAAFILDLIGRHRVEAWPACLNLAGPLRSLHGIMEQLLAIAREHGLRPEIVRTAGSGASTGFCRLSTERWLGLNPRLTPDALVLRRLWDFVAAA